MSCLKSIFACSSAGLWLCAFAATSLAQPVGSGASADPSAAATAEDQSEAFTGTLTIRQKGGGLYYKVYLVEGRAIGGFDSWRGSSKRHHRVVGGWYDGERMTLLMQSTQNDLEDKWFSHAHHFCKQGEGFTLEQTLYGDGKSIATGEVYQPHEIDEVINMSAEDVRRQADEAKPGEASKGAEADEPVASNDEAKNDRRAAGADEANSTHEGENARLKKLVAELLRENESLKRRLSQD